MNHALHAIYPVLLGAVDLAIGAGFLYLQGLSLLGLLMTGIGAVMICHVAYDAAHRTNSAFHSVTGM